MGPFTIADDYPGSAANGCDYISGNPRGEITENGPGDRKVRPEKVVVSQIDIVGEGTLCFGERTARSMAHLFGMVDGWRVQALMAATQAVVDERDLLSRELAEARSQIDNLLETHRNTPEEVFVAADGTRHASLDAAENAGRQQWGLAPKALTGMRPLTELEVGA